MEYRIKPALIDQIREARGVSSDEAVAASVGISLGTVSRIRRGFDVKLATAIKLMEAAGVTDIKSAVQAIAEEPTEEPAA